MPSDGEWVLAAEEAQFDVPASIPVELKQNFAALQDRIDDGTFALHYCNTVHVRPAKGVPPKGVVVVLDANIFCCLLDGEIERCISISNVSSLVIGNNPVHATVSPFYLAIIVDCEWDVVFHTPDTHKLATVVRRLYKSITGHELSTDNKEATAISFLINRPKTFPKATELNCVAAWRPFVATPSVQRVCAVCGESGRPGKSRSSGWKCNKCIGTASRGSLDLTGMARRLSVRLGAAPAIPEPAQTDSTSHTAEGQCVLCGNTTLGEMRNSGFRCTSCMDIPTSASPRGKTCVVCGRNSRPGKLRSSGFKCNVCVGLPHHPLHFAVSNGQPVVHPVPPEPRKPIIDSIQAELMTRPCEQLGDREEIHGVGVTQWKIAGNGGFKVVLDAKVGPSGADASVEVEFIRSKNIKLKDSCNPCATVVYNALSATLTANQELVAWLFVEDDQVEAVLDCVVLPSKSTRRKLYDTDVWLTVRNVPHYNGINLIVDNFGPDGWQFIFDVRGSVNLVPLVNPVLTSKGIAKRRPYNPVQVEVIVPPYAHHIHFLRMVPVEPKSSYKLRYASEYIKYFSASGGVIGSFAMSERKDLLEAQAHCDEINQADGFDECEIEEESAPRREDNAADFTVGPTESETPVADEDEWEPLEETALRRDADTDDPEVP